MGRIYWLKECRGAEAGDYLALAARAGVATALALPKEGPALAVLVALVVVAVEGWGPGSGTRLAICSTLLFNLLLGHLDGHHLAGGQAFLDLRVEVIGNPNLHQSLLERFALLDINEPLHDARIHVLLGEYRGERNGGHVGHRGDGDFDVGGHARAHPRVDVLEQDSGGITLDIVLDGRLRIDALDHAGNLEASDGLHGDFDHFVSLDSRNVRLINLGVDNHGAQVGDGKDLGAAVEAARTGNGLSHGDRPGEDGAIEGGANFGLGEVFLGDRQVPLGAFKRVLGEVKLSLGVVIQLLGNELIRQQLLGPFEIPLGLLEAQPCLVDIGQVGRLFLLQLFVIQLEQQSALLDDVAHIHRKTIDLAIDFRPDRDLLGGADLAGRADREVDIAQLNGSGGGTRGGQFRQVGLLPILPIGIAADGCANQRYPQNPLFHSR